MKTDKNGCSTVKPGEEQYEGYYSYIARGDRIQYDYRSQSGRLFSCIGKTLAECRNKRDKWLSLLGDK